MKEQLVFNFSAAGLGADSFLPTRTCPAVEDKKLKRKLYLRFYYLKNKDKLSRYVKKWRSENALKAFEYGKRWREKNKQKAKQYQADYRAKNFKKARAYEKHYYTKNRQMILDRVKAWAKKNRPSVIAARKDYYQKTKPERRKYQARKYKTDAEYRLASCLRSRVIHALFGAKKSSNTFKLIGCSKGELKTWLESKFKPGMTWENHGRFGWHIDHIRPCSSFDLSIPEEQAACFHYTNLQPLWAYENLSKSDKVITPAKHCPE